MAWMPWYERMVEMDTAEEREEFIKGVFGGPQHAKGPNALQTAGMVTAAAMIGWGLNRAIRGKR